MNLRLAARLAAPLRGLRPRIGALTSPLTQLTMGLVSLTGLLVVLAELFFGVMPTRSEQALQLRKQVGESVAVQVAALLRQQDRAVLQATLDDVTRRTPGLLSVAVRRTDGEIVAGTTGHDRHWRHDGASLASTPQAVLVPLSAAGRPWGRFEMAFEPPRLGLVGAFLAEPLVLTLLFISIAGTLVFRLYIRRALQHLDPSSAIPDRVQHAFDTMSEGVVVLDGQARLMLCNVAFRRLHTAAAGSTDVKPDNTSDRSVPEPVAMGSVLSDQAWAREAFGRNAAAHPWTSVLERGVAASGIQARVRMADGDHSELIVNAAPVRDGSARVRGCIVTFSDVTELHEVNAALRVTLGELAASKEEIERKNTELHRLATRDPMTGCLNRRSFMELYHNLFMRSKAGQSSLGVIVLDIDHFKSVNDTHGHSIGDRVIQEVAKKLGESARSSDLICRYGGEEFVVACAGLSPTAMQNLGERLRARIEAEAGESVREVSGMRVTVSVGIALLTPQTAAEQQLIDAADAALYEAKRGGRNQVRLAPLAEASSVMGLLDD